MRERRGRWPRCAVFLALFVMFAFGAIDWTGANAQLRVTQLRVTSNPTILLAQAPPTEARLLREGKTLYGRECEVCHGAEGEGDAGPKLSGNDFMKSRGRIVAQIFEGNDEHGMPAYYDSLNDRQTAAIATYVRNSWGNEFGVVLPEEVARMR